VLAPAEVRSLRASVDAASRRAAEIDLVNSAGAPFAGVDLDIDDLSLDTQELAPGYAKVMVNDAAISFGGDASKFSDMVRHAVPEMRGGTYDLATDGAPFGVRPFVMAVERDGHWYVSPAYTVFEYVRVVNDLPPADFGSGRAAIASLGATSPEAAARGALDAFQAADWSALFSYAPPDELPVYDYRAALSQLIARDYRPSFTTDVFDATARVDGDRAEIDVVASGHFADGNTWKLAGNCLDSTNTFTTYENTGPVTETGHESFCAQSSSALPYSYFGGVAADGPTRITAVQRAGRWFVSPVGSVLAYLDEWIAHVDHDQFAVLLNDPGAVTPTGAIALGKGFTVEANDVAAYTFQGRAGQRVVAQVRESEDARHFGSAMVSIVGPDGNLVSNGSDVAYGQPATLERDGTYRAVLWTSAGGAEVTLWDADQAPPGVVDEAPLGANESCVTSGTTVTCSGSGSAVAPSLDDLEHSEATTVPTTIVPASPKP